MKQIVKVIPSLLTLGNLLCGFAAIVLADPLYSMALICIAAVIDTFDGLVARALNATSDFGKQIDSLADIVSFGVAPGVLIYQHLLHPNYYSVVLAGLIPLFAAIRLARFNTDARQSVSFRGLPTPAAGLFLIPLPFIDLEYGFYLYGNPLLTIIIIAVALLMVLPLPMFSFKAMKKTGTEKVFPILLLAGSVALIIFMKWQALPLAVILYILLSVVYTIWRPKKNDTA